MRQFRVFHPLWMAFYSKPLYREVGRIWTGIGVGYLFLLLALAWLPLLGKMHTGFSGWVATDAEKVVTQFPKVYIKNGEVSVDPPGRHVINDPDSGKPFIIIDLDARFEDLDKLEGDLVVLTRTKLIMQRSRRSETRIYDLSGVQNFSMTQDDIRGWMQWGANFLAILIFPFLLLGSFVYRLVQILLYAVFGLLFANAHKVNISYDSLVRLSAVAITPAVILNVLHDFSTVKMPLWWLCCFLISMAYLNFGVMACKQAETPSSLPSQPYPTPPGPA
jgi:hypothetical protein